MKNTTFAIYAVPVALLMMAGTLATPSATADTARERTTVQGVFTYDRNAPAEAIYARLQRTAERLCIEQGPHYSLIRKHDRACIASVVQDGVSRIGRLDLVQLHDRARG